MEVKFARACAWHNAAAKFQGRVEADNVKELNSQLLGLLPTCAV
jgi:hypothetical protein